MGRLFIPLNLSFFGGGGGGGGFPNTKVGSNTKHGEQRLKERGFSKQDIDNTKSTTNVKTQSDGVKVYIKEVSSGKFNVIVEGERSIITALKSISQKSLDRLIKNYGWK